MRNFTLIVVSLFLTVLVGCNGTEDASQTASKDEQNQATVETEIKTNESTEEEGPNGEQTNKVEEEEMAVENDDEKYNNVKDLSTIEDGFVLIYDNSCESCNDLKHRLAKKADENGVSVSFLNRDISDNHELIESFQPRRVAAPELIKPSESEMQAFLDEQSQVFSKINQLFPPGTDQETLHAFNHEVYANTSPIVEKYSSEYSKQLVDQLKQKLAKYGIDNRKVPPHIFSSYVESVVYVTANDLLDNSDFVAEVRSAATQLAQSYGFPADLISEYALLTLQTPQPKVDASALTLISEMDTSLYIIVDGKPFLNISAQGEITNEQIDKFVQLMRDGVDFG